ncbi:MAG: hypothetical protein WC878_02465 [Candidatus Paceibacterota bacterium]|jgi:hypothetical protein
MSILSVALTTVAVVLCLVGIAVSILIASHKTVEMRKENKEPQQTNKKDYPFKKVFSWLGWGSYLFISLHLFYRFVLAHLPSESLAVVRAIPPFAALEVLVFIVGTVMLWKMYKTKPEAAVPAGTKAVPVPKKEPTILGDWKILLMMALGYVLFGIGQELNIFNGGLSYTGLTLLPEGMLYIPYTGLFYAALLMTFLLLAMTSDNDSITMLGYGLGLIFAFASFNGFWFMPYNAAHMVHIPALQFLGGTGIYFPADPMVSWKWIAGAVFLSYLFAKSIHTKKSINTDVGAVVVLITAAAIFLPQLIHL